MKHRLIILFAAFVLGTATSMAFGNKEEGMGANEFKRQHQKFICEQAKLTPKEAAAFFPIYDECQEKKRKLNNQIWDLRKEARGKDLNEKEYQHILEKIANLRIQIDELDKNYLPIYKKVLPYKKIFDVQGAESRFHREMLRKMAPPKDKPRKK